MIPNLDVMHDGNVNIGDYDVKSNLTKNFFFSQSFQSFINYQVIITILA